MSTSTLAIFDRTLPIYICTDASQNRNRAVLKQPQPNSEEKPVAYFSKKLNEPQKKKEVIYTESYDIREAVKFSKFWLLGKKFTIFIDHKPFENINLKSRTYEGL